MFVVGVVVYDWIKLVDEFFMKVQVGNVDDIVNFEFVEGFDRYF